jgi:hypothetical protein
MKKIILSLTLLFVFSSAQEPSSEKNINIVKETMVQETVHIKGGRGPSLLIDPSVPIEVGITSFKQGGSSYFFSVYMINHQAVSGVQLDIQPNNFFIVDEVYGGRAEKNNFALHYNKSGRILGFSMSGGFIPESSSLDKSKNILFNVEATSDSKLDIPIIITAIFADKDAQRMEFISIPFEIGK